MTKSEALKAVLARAFREAYEAAEGAAPGDDAGTCNRDCAVYRPERWVTNRLIQEAAAEAHVRVSISHWFGRAAFLYVSHGQGNRRTRMAEAACNTLKAHGLDATVFYQMD